MNNWILKQRALVSFDGDCPLQCKHCYTYQLDKAEKARSIKEIVDSLSNKEFDVIYVSQKKENFVNPQEGIALCKALYERYHKDIFIITRIALKQEILCELKILSEKMKQTNNLLYIAYSIPALGSYGITEREDRISTPKERIDSLKRAKKLDLHTILMIRPLYPSFVIPVNEIMELISNCQENIDCIVASGIAVNKKILEQLKFDNFDFKYLQDSMTDYLVGAIPYKLDYVDVKSELKEIKKYCVENSIAFFDHSMFALNYIKSIN